MTTNLEKNFYLALSKNFKMFVEKCHNEVGGGQQYVETIATELIADKLMSIQNGDIKRSIINVSPRSLKTTLVSIAFTAWLLGHNPKLKILCISDGDEPAKDFSIKTRQIMRSDWYKKTFPDTRLSLFGQRDVYIQTTKNGCRKATSLEGQLTGFGADIIIIDDPQKSAEIKSDQIRKKTNEIFSNTIISRLNDKVNGKIIIVAQRLHQDDFSSYVQKFDNWDILKIPAIAEQETIYKLSDGSKIIRNAGDVINPILEPLDKLENIRKGMGDFDFSAQYQQEPIPLKGNIINFDDFRFFKSNLSLRTQTTVQSWDCALKTGVNNDFSVCVTAKIINEIVYIIDIYRCKLEFPDLLKEIKRKKRYYCADTIIIEEAGIGAGLIQDLDSEGINVIPFKPKDSKPDRAACVTNLIRNGRVRLLEGAGWLNDFADEVRAFPYGAHDDQVDALVQLLTLVKNDTLTSHTGVVIIDNGFPDYSDDITELRDWLLEDYYNEIDQDEEEN